MIIDDIKHKTVLIAIKKHNITNDILQNIANMKDLHLYIRRASQKLWYHNNKDYFKNKYINEYKERVLPIIKARNSFQYYFKKLPNC